MSVKEKNESKKTSTGFILGITKIDVEDFKNNVPVDLDVTNDSSIKFEYRARLKTDEEKRRLTLSIYYAFIRDEETLFEIRVNTEFIISSFQDYITANHSKKKILMNRLVDVANAHTRAILAMKLEGFKMRALHLPFLRPDEISDTLLTQDK
ncbi:hypothetical protein QTN47_17225 [Danxiaibacter flavus]|uniref:Preprotein translocase subunit SecB n=1 Tax=Danxiaibacter flavus TaxID=3049108 RepID=A0ABV3ZI62_9BACT|nr:hypothetical protein QNM32_17235 [Chitinophagaceae bacterium DXS]